jgi:uroporphyrinogen-III synthase
MTTLKAGASPLQGKGVLVTRPQEQAQELIRLILDQGGRPILFPALEIRDAADLVPLYGLIDRLDEFDMAVFVSPTAVNKAMNLIKSRRDMPACLAIAAIGKGSRMALERFGVREVIAPEGRFDSEALLELPKLKSVAGKRVVIFRGEGGRETLGDEIGARGARVEYAECYRRAKPDADSAQLLRLWARGELNAVTVTSSEGLRNLYEMVGKLGRQWLKKTPLFAFHPRIVSAAKELGIENARLTAEGDKGLVMAMLEWFAHERDA